MAFFKQRAHRRFNYKPVFWDKEAEERKIREKRIRMELGMDEDGEEYVPDIRESIRKEFDRRKANRPTRLSNYSIRLFFVLTLLLLLAYYLLTYHSQSILKFFGL